MNNCPKYLKSLVAIGLLWLAIPLSLAAYQIPEFVIINAGLGKQFGLKVEGLDHKQAEFTVTSDRGEVLLQQRINGEDYKALYSLEKLHEGAYIFILKTSTTEIRQPVKLTRRAVHYHLSDRKILLTPEVTLSGRQLDIDFQNPSQEQFKVALLLSNGDALYTETFESRIEIEQRINLLKVPRGSYRLEMSTPSAKWQEVIEVR